MLYNTKLCSSIAGASTNPSPSAKGIFRAVSPEHHVPLKCSTYNVILLENKRKLTDNDHFPFLILIFFKVTKQKGKTRDIAFSMRGIVFCNLYICRLIFSNDASYQKIFFEYLSRRINAVNLAMSAIQN